MKNQIAEKIYHHFLEEYNPDVIGHPLKRKAVRLAMAEYPKWFEVLRESKDRIQYLDSLPMIGPITKYHLARNLGIDCAKPDRHLARLAQKFGFINHVGVRPQDLTNKQAVADMEQGVHRMCKALADFTGWRIGTVDVILWRYCNMQSKQFLKR